MKIKLGDKTSRMGRGRLGKGGSLRNLPATVVDADEGGLQDADARRGHDGP